MSKTDQFGNGVTIHLGSTGNNICPVSALLQYLAIRPTAPGPLFISHEGKYLPRSIRLLQMQALTLHSTAVTHSGLERQQPQPHADSMIV